VKVTVYQKLGQPTQVIAGHPGTVLLALGFKYEEAEETAESFCESYSACHSHEKLTICDLALAAPTKEVCQERADELTELAGTLGEDQADLANATSNLLKQFMGDL
jgi:hypothetical protein